jgi:hypothetical protein
MNARKQLLECGALFLILFALGWSASADVVQTTSGDRYVGSIVAFTNGTLVFKSDIVGVVKIPKTRLAQVSFGSVAATNLPPAKSMANIQTNAPVTAESDLSKVLSQLQAHTNLISGIQAKLLSDAGPEANEQFNKMVSGLLSGQISVADVRAQAAKAAADLREARKDLGEDSSVMIDSYLAILDRFLANSGSNTNR